MSPTTIFPWSVHPRVYIRTSTGRGRGVPGVVQLGVGWEGYTRYPPSTLLGPIFSIFLRLRPYHGQMKAILRYLMRFPQMGLELT